MSKVRNVEWKVIMSKMVKNVKSKEIYVLKIILFFEKKNY